MSMVPAATPLATETTGTAGTTTAASGTANTGTTATGTATTGTATTGTTATGTTATGTTATGTTGTESTTAAAPAAAGTTTGTAATGTTSGTQTASVPPGSATTTEGEIRIAFPADSADIPDATKGQLDALAQKMAGDENIRIQLLAYASGTSDQASRARRMALSRALAVRSYLIKQGVRSTRMDVRALGNNVEGSPADRVDIIPKTQ
jgi:outer membrane protein OmpA-like peptidoglycan-associated protein